ncbi:tetratricopeptide repeat protein [Roseateles sp. DB2]|uniref:tetratricopeptide repeat protein n=1 Tax=Roseateles sp. DB2 TaxID=3453717 RepID=UPI003EF03B06
MSQPRLSAPLRLAGMALLLGLLQACATAPRSPLPLPPLLDEALAPAAALPSREDLLALSPAMKEFLEQTVQPKVQAHGVKEGLLKALYRDGQLRLQYDAEKTRTAAETFADGRGNCLSLVLMTAAFAQELRLPVYFRSVLVDPQWSRSDSLIFQAGHVNLGLGTRLQERAFAGTLEAPVIVDFLPEEGPRGSRAVEVSVATITAMFYNNRAAELLNAGDVRGAYWWARAAVLADARFSGGFNTLAVLYRRLGRLDLAERVLAQLLAQEPDNEVALANMVFVLREARRPQDLHRYEERLAALRPEPPFKFFDEGRAAMKRQEFLAADALFARELARSANNHELHFWAALAKLALGQQERAARHLALAAETSPTPGQQRIYEAKREALLAHRMH